MSRKVDRRKPLSDSDRAYLLARGRPTDVYPDAESEQEVVTESDEEPDDDYDEWKVSELRAELEESKLSTDGNKAALVARLRERDAAEE